MDHILENEGNPVPDLSSVSEVAPRSSAGGAEPMNEDEDEDAEALRAVYAKGGSSNTADAPEEAKVRQKWNIKSIPLHAYKMLTRTFMGPEHQMFNMR